MLKLNEFCFIVAVSLRQIIISAHVAFTVDSILRAHPCGFVGAEWGTDNAFPKLEFLTISNGSSSTGTFGGNLPSEWGSAGGLPSLRYLFLDRNHFSGVLPDSWGRQLNLSWVDLGYNVELIGTLSTHLLGLIQRADHFQSSKQSLGPEAAKLVT